MKLPRIPAPYVGWALFVGNVCALFLAVGSGLAWHSAHRAEARADAAKAEWVVARDSMNALLAGDWRKLGPYDRVYYGRPPGDTLPRAVR